MRKHAATANVSRGIRQRSTKANGDTKNELKNKSTRYVSSSSGAETRELPINGESLFSRLTYSWLTPIVTLGNERSLEVSDLWKVDDQRSAEYLSTHLDAAWERRRQEALSIATGDTAPSRSRRIWWNVRTLATSDTQEGLEQRWRSEAGSAPPSLPGALNEVVGSFFWIGGLCKVFADICQMMGPVFIKAIINFAKERSKAQERAEEGPRLLKGIALAIGLLLLTISTSLAHHQFFWRSIVAGTLSRTALVSSVYRRTVNLTSKSRTKLSNAAIINHISTDVSRVEACAQWFHPVWASPIQVAICLTILLLHLGPSALAGFAIFLLVIPLQKRILRRQISIRKRLSKLTELRTKSLVEALSSMHFIKCYTLEFPFLRRISALRRAELTGVKQIQNIQSANAALAFSLPVLAATLAFFAYTRSGDFDLAIMFASINLFQLLRQPMTFWPRALSLTGDAIGSLKRLSDVYTAETIGAHSTPVIDLKQRLALSVRDASFEWEEPSTKGDPKTRTSLPFSLRNIDIEVTRGGLVAIVGPVASGKSSLLQGLVGEMRRTCGEVIFGGKVAYCPQVPWIRRGTLRENIVFGGVFHEEKYWKVLKDVGLLEDIHSFEDGDLTQIGEDGATVSGGQNQRIALARALYLDSDILLLDDPLSGVDPGVGNAILRGPILSAAKSMKKTVFLVTNRRDILPYCDTVIHLENGRILENLGNSSSTNPATSPPMLPKAKRKKAAPFLQGCNPPGRCSLKSISEEVSSATNRGMGSENPQVKRNASCKVYQAYFTAGQGFWSAPAISIAVILMQGSQMLSSRTMIWWQSNTYSQSFTFYKALYAAFGILQACFTYLIGATVDSIACLASQSLHDKALWNILHSPMSFIEATPRGRILSLLGKDVDSIDNQLPSSIRTLCLTAGTVLGSISIIIFVQPRLIAVALVVFTGYQHFLRVYRGTSGQLKRIESTLRSDVYAHITECLTGLQTLRSYDQVERSIGETDRLLDLQNRASFLSATSQRWLSVRLDFCGAVLVFSVALCAILGVGSVSAAHIGLILTYTTTLTQMCGLLTRQIADVETQMNAVERMCHFLDQSFIQEGAPTKEQIQAPHNWPEKGAVSLQGVYVNYRIGLPAALSNVSIEINPGEKVGIVGRTGAGKSSLVNSLMRIVEYTGTIEIDGIDISQLSLKGLRSKLSFVPQQPVVFGGTIRSALDPHGQYTDDALRCTLGRAFAGAENGPDSKRCLELDATVESNGANLSLGERALLSVARVLLRNSRIIILDEATASVDCESDINVQRAIHREFNERTLICIAHRIRTVLPYDRILVLHGGSIIELDTPLGLYDKGGVFNKLCSESCITRKDILSAKWGTS
ncbi:ABC protein [Ephemerocybe angulata]|uniref:ABC protein n=1 Tax=Ephemerocybe angulata TaxID=980116 RepID=A0A8H6I3D4_9AGAR|nr:ABC protein [Tulosesus angulatus]